MNFVEEFDLNLEIALTIGIILVSTFILVRVVRWLINKSFNKASLKIKVDPTRYKFFKNALSFIIWMFAIGLIVLMIPKLKTLVITLFAGAGIFLAIVGFAAQAAFSKIISGIFIVLLLPFSVGAMINVVDYVYGVLDDISPTHRISFNL